MQPHDFEEANRSMTAPNGREGKVATLRVYAGEADVRANDGTQEKRPVMVSLWKPTLTELAILCNGGDVQLTIWGEFHPAVALSVYGELPELSS